MSPPQSIVWAPIPCLSHLCPLVGHFGLTDSQGIIHDFGGHQFVNRSSTTTVFGPPTRYKQVTETCPPEVWDNGIRLATEEFEKRLYSFFGNNCHHFVAYALECMTSKPLGVCTLLYRYRVGAKALPSESAPLISPASVEER